MANKLKNSQLKGALPLTKKIKNQKNMPLIILNERAANFGSYTFFTRDVDQY